MLLLDRLSSGDVFDTLSDVRERLDLDSIVYISDTIERPKNPTTHRRVEPINLMRWLDRSGLRIRQHHTEDLRIYATAELVEVDPLKYKRRNRQHLNRRNSNA